MAKRRRDTFVPLDDTCQVCHRKISWMFGGLFWLHYDSRNVDHEGKPTTRTDLQPFTGCRAHRPLRPDECDACKKTDPLDIGPLSQPTDTR